MVEKSFVDFIGGRNFSEWDSYSISYKVVKVFIFFFYLIVSIVGVLYLTSNIWVRLTPFLINLTAHLVLVYFYQIEIKCYSIGSYVPFLQLGDGYKETNYIRITRLVLVVIITTILILGKFRFGFSWGIVCAGVLSFLTGGVLFELLYAIFCLSIERILEIYHELQKKHAVWFFKLSGQKSHSLVNDGKVDLELKYVGPSWDKWKATWGVFDGMAGCINYVDGECNIIINRKWEYKIVNDYNSATKYIKHFLFLLFDGGVKGITTGIFDLIKEIPSYDLELFHQWEWKKIPEKPIRQLILRAFQKLSLSDKNESKVKYLGFKREIGFKSWNGKFEQ